MRKFEKISFDEFKKDIKEDIDLYNSYEIPIRKTKKSCGYDFLAIEEFSIKPGEIKKIPTGIKVSLNENEFLMIVVRSSMGFKYNIRLCNQVGIIDADYYNNPDNEGHMYVALQNEGNKEYIVKKGEGFAQGIILNYLTCGDENNQIRNGGIGSTNERNDKNE